MRRLRQGAAAATTSGGFRPTAVRSDGRYALAHINRRALYCRHLPNAASRWPSSPPQLMAFSGSALRFSSLPLMKHRDNRRTTVAALRLLVDRSSQQRRCCSTSGQQQIPSPPLPPPSHADWQAMKVAELKEELRKRGLKVTGKKQELVDRLCQQQEHTTAGGAAAPITGARRRRDGPFLRVVLAEKPSVAQNIARALGLKAAGGSKAGYIGQVTLGREGTLIVNQEEEGKEQDGDNEQNPANKQKKEKEEYTVITWALGHLLELQSTPPQWSLDKLPLLPDSFAYSLKPAHKQQFEVIRKLFLRADEIVNACDAGREGELIFRLLYEKTAAACPVKRLWISSLTDEAIKKGFEQLQPSQHFDSLYASALARERADWLLGINATQAYTLVYSSKVPHFQRQVLSLGRVQTPVLSMIVDRWKEVQDWKPTPYFELHVNCIVRGETLDEGTHIPFKYVSHNSTSGDHVKTTFNDRIPIRQEGEQIAGELSDECTVHSFVQKTRKETPPHLFDLTTLQKEANQRYSFTADKTLKILQRLYERYRLITYPRTDSSFLSPDLYSQVHEVVSKLNATGKHKNEILAEATSKALSGSRLNSNNKLVFDAKKVSDHHAIIPTPQLHRDLFLSSSETEPSSLSTDELRVYKLIVARFVAAFLPDCEKKDTTLTVVNQKHRFQAKAVSILDPGWRSISHFLSASTSTSGEHEDEEGTTEQASRDDTNGGLAALRHPLKKGDKLKCILPASLKQKETRPPPILTESALLHMMETAGARLEDAAEREAMKGCGLGTPATRAAIIERLIAVGHVQREGRRRLIPTEKGLSLVALVRKIDESLCSPRLTAEWEQRLQSIWKEGADHNSFLSDIKEFTQHIVEHAKKGAGARVRRLFAVKPSSSSTAASASSSSSPSATAASSQKSFGGVGTKGEQEVEELTTCWKCKEGTLVTQPHWKGWSCSRKKTHKCDFVVWKKVAGRDLGKDVVKKLVEEGVSSLLKFTSKQGNPFKARLAINEDAKVVFLFPNTIHPAQ
ncbi:DNA topoisomerase [Balamuthia mandrillaris]